MNRPSGAEAVADPGGGTQSSRMETIIEMSEIDEQTRTLLKLVLFIFALARNLGHLGARVSGVRLPA